VGTGKQWQGLFKPADVGKSQAHWEVGQITYIERKKKKIIPYAKQGNGEGSTLQMGGRKWL